MNLRPRRSEDPEINLISLIDILLVLVLFFLVSTTFSVDGRLRIRLPQASSVPLQRTSNEPLIVTVTANGSYLVNGRELVNSTADTLRAAILKVAGERPMAIGECAVLPNAALLAAQPRWVFFMSWAELTFTSNSPQQVKDLYGLPTVITRELLPRFRP